MVLVQGMQHEPPPTPAPAPSREIVSHNVGALRSNAAMDHAVAISQWIGPATTFTPATTYTPRPSDARPRQVAPGLRIESISTPRASARAREAASVMSSPSSPTVGAASHGQQQQQQPDAARIASKVSGGAAPATVSFEGSPPKDVSVYLKEVEDATENLERAKQKAQRTQEREARASEAPSAASPQYPRLEDLHSARQRRRAMAHALQGMRG